ncbi:flagellar basal body rod protein FlgB [Siminovitchia sp. FSL H7-0308]|uniref:Flagellar basal body rod protein FlgB n=1 Tax=Siminovitchia thermophila TaxID=1245522 RepID=A0ABS2RA28_9BACI|nr:flagellar basal body rod protein FlgB [Siminovitchia thermophila]MBM7716485.1 flagellar basal-body rod protein FlgB [Siminovitchia thermophila]ONK23346.1 flagellar basal body rod protein FlgB [Bacillus sp. VT-16-64]
MTLFSGIFPTLEASLKYSTIKHEVSSQNIANADTPNYKGKRVSFKKALDNSVANMKSHRTDPRHFTLKSDLHPTTGIDNVRVQYRHDGNSVDIDKEMSDLAANQIYFNAISDRLNGKFNSLKNVIKGGR